MANEPTSRIAELEKEVARLNHLIEIARAEKTDMVQRNELLRRRLDAHPEVLKPRLAILKRLDDAEAENQQLREDAARLDWLRENLVWSDMGKEGSLIRLLLPCKWGTSLREAIDKARNRQ